MLGMKRSHRWLGCLVLLPALTFAALAQVPAQPFPPPPQVPPRGDPVPPDVDMSGNVFWPVLVLPTEDGLTKRLEAARDYIRVKDYPLGLRQVQWVLDAPEDVLIKPKGEVGRPDPSSWQSVRRQAEGILEELTPQGRDTYRTLYEPQARTMLDKARQATDPQMLAEIVRRYRHTPSGETALNLLAGYHLDRGQSHQAARRYAELFRLHPADKQTIGTLVRATAAFRGAGDAASADKAWQALQARASSGKIKLGGRDVTLAELDRGLGKLPGATVRFDARVFRGDEKRNGVFSARPPLLEPFVTVDTCSEQLGRDLLSKARSNSPRALPGRHMVAAGNKVLFRSASGIVALDGVTGQQVWTAPMELTLEGLLRDPARKQQILRWNTYYKDALQGLLYENTLTGTLSTDGQNVYAVDDTALPVPPFMLFEMASGRRHLFSTLKDWLACNKLCAFDLATGKPAWQIGGPKGKTAAEFADVLFLGPPLPLEGLLWVLVEKQQKMLLYALDPATGALRWSQNLGAVSDKIQMNLVRRCSAVHLAAADGLLIVPTHHGAVIAVDPLGRNLVWARTYADKPAINWDNITPELPQVRDQWAGSFKGGAPMIAGGRIVLTGPDTQAVRCLNLDDGRLLWTADTSDEDQYVAAIHKETVLVVGRNACRALSLKDGKDLWKQPVATGLPSGQGVLSEGTYWLPVLEGGLWGIDLEKGQVPVRLGTSGSPVLGNLLVHEGAFWSQDALKVSAFPDVGKRLLALDDVLTLNPENHTARLDRAQMRLGQGETQGALKDVRLALASPDLGAERTPRAKELLFNALTQLLLRDPAAAEPFLPEYLDLTNVPIPLEIAPEARARLERDRARRRIQAGGLVARSYAAAGRHRAATELLLRLVRNSGNELIPTPDEPLVEARADVLAEGYLREILREAAPAGQEDVRAALAGAAKEPTGAGGLEGLLRLARMADLLPGPDRMALLERLLSVNVAPGRVLLLLDALEGRLKVREDVAGVLLLRAEALTRAGLIVDAADCYRRLGSEFADLAVRGRSTGAQLLAAAREDKRLLLSFEGPAEWSASRYTVKEERVSSTEPAQPLVRMTDDHELGFSNPASPADYPLRYTRPASSMARSLRIAFDIKDRKIQVQDAAGTVLWSVPALSTSMDRMVQGFPPGGFVVLGPIAVVHVNCMVYGLDLLERRVRWSVRVLEAEKNPQLLQGLTFSMEGRLEVLSPDGQFLLRVGLGGPAAPDRVLLQLRGSVAALDPATGAFLWQRGDMPPVLLAGDEEAVLLMEGSPNDPSVRQVRALRPADGRVVRLAPGTRDLLQPQQRLRLLGRDVLVQEPSKEGERRLRRVDPVTGEERWRLSLPDNAGLLDSPLRNTMGVVRPLGGGAVAIRLLDLNAGKEGDTVLSLGKDQLDLNEKHFLLADARNWYIVGRVPFGGVGLLSDPNYHVPMTVPVLPANGVLHAFDRATGRHQWRARLPGQMLITDPFEEIPFVLAVSQVVRQGGNGPGGPGKMAILVRVLDKKTGKLLFDRDEEMPENATNPQRIPYFMPFHALNVDPLGNWLELAGPAVRLRVTGQ
jgi:outer membrane protein assembly factor BamB